MRSRLVWILVLCLAAVATTWAVRMASDKVVIIRDGSVEVIARDSAPLGEDTNGDEREYEWQNNAAYVVVMTEPLAPSGCGEPPFIFSDFKEVEVHIAPADADAQGAPAAQAARPARSGGRGVVSVRNSGGLFSKLKVKPPKKWKLDRHPDKTSPRYTFVDEDSLDTHRITKVVVKSKLQDDWSCDTATTYVVAFGK